MRKIAKIFLFIVALLLLAGLLLILSQFVNIPYISSFTVTALQNYSWLATALAVVVVFFLIATVVGLLTDIFGTESSKNYEMRENMGRIEVSKKSIESTADIAMGEVPGVRRHSAKLQGSPHPGKVTLNVTAEVEPNSKYIHTGEEIQTHVADGLAASLGIQPEKVHVKLTPVSSQTSAKMEGPRVQ